MQSNLQAVYIIFTIILMSSVASSPILAKHNCNNNCISCLSDHGEPYCEICYQAVNRNGTCSSHQDPSGSCHTYLRDGNCESCKAGQVLSIDSEKATCKSKAQSTPSCHTEEKQADGSWKCLSCYSGIPGPNGKTCSDSFPGYQDLLGCAIGSLNEGGYPKCVGCKDGQIFKFKNSRRNPVCQSQSMMVYPGCLKYNVASYSCTYCDGAKGYFKTGTYQHTCTKKN